MTEVVTDPAILAQLDAPAQPQAVTDPALLEQLNAPAPKLLPSNGFYGRGPMPSNVTPSQVALDNSSAGRVLDAFDQGARNGWGDQPLGLSEASLKALRDSGHLVSLEEAYKAPVTFFNDVLMQSGAVAFDLATRGPNAIFQGLRAAGAAAADPGITPGEAAIPSGGVQDVWDAANAYLPEFGGGIGRPRATLSDARALGVTVGEAEFAGTKLVPGSVEFNVAMDASRPGPVAEAAAAAAALPPVGRDFPVGSGEVPAQGLVVAVLDKEGKVHYGAPGTIHAQLWKVAPDDVAESGFAGPDGKFYTREEAAKFVPGASAELHATDEAALSAAEVGKPVTTPDAPTLPATPSKVEVPVAPVQHFDDMPPSTAKDQTKLNLNYDEPQSIVDFLRQQAVEAGDYTDARRSGTSWAETERLGQAMGLTAQDIASRQVGQIHGASWMDAATNTLVQSTRDVRDAWQKAATGSDADKLAALEAEAQHAMLMASVVGNEAEIGRALNILKKFKQTTAEARDVDALIKENGGVKGLAERARKGATLDTPQQVSGFIRDSMKPRLGGMLQELWVNWLLSGPITQVKNIAGNVTTAVWRTTEAYASAGAGLLRGLPEERVTFGEANQRAYAVLSSGPEMLKAGWKAWKEDSDTGKLDTGKFQQIPSMKVTVGGHDFMIGGKQLRIPGRALGAMDAAFKTLAYRQSIHAQAWRRAVKADLKTKDAFDRTLAQLKNSPTVGMIERAKKEAELQTLSQPLGSTGRAIQTVANHNLLTKMIAPFVKFGINSAKFAGERSILSVLHPEIRETLLGKNGAIARDEQIAKIVVGSAVSATAVYMASRGMVTGGGPKDPKERALLRQTGWQPYSFKVGGVYYAGNWNDPASTLFFVAADMYEIGSHITDTDAGSIAELVMASVVNNITSKSYFQGLSDATDVMNDPGRYGEQWLNKQAGTVVPTGVAQMARMQDPYLRDARTIVDTIKSRLPKTPLNPEFNSESVFPKRDLWGNAIKREGALGPDAISPVYMSAEKNDPVTAELLSMGVFPAKVDRQIRGVDLTVRQYDDYQRVAGKLLRYQLEQVTGMAEWATITPGVRREILTKTINSSRELARSYILMAYPQIAVDATNSKIESLSAP